MTYRAQPCPCGHPGCKAWHVSGVAAVPGVCFTEYQARLCALFLNLMEKGIRRGEDVEADIRQAEEDFQ